MGSQQHRRELFFRLRLPRHENSAGTPRACIFGGVDPSKRLFLCVVMHSATDTDWYIDGKYYKGVRITDGRGTSMDYSNASGTIGASLPNEAISREPSMNFGLRGLPFLPIKSTNSMICILQPSSKFRRA